MERSSHRVSVSIPVCFPSPVRREEIMIPVWGNQLVDCVICLVSYSRLRAPPVAAGPWLTDRHIIIANHADLRWFPLPGRLIPDFPDRRFLLSGIFIIRAVLIQVPLPVVLWICRCCSSQWMLWAFLHCYRNNSWWCCPSRVGYSLRCLSSKNIIGIIVQIPCKSRHSQCLCVFGVRYLLVKILQFKLKSLHDVLNSSNI